MSHVTTLHINGTSRPRATDVVIAPASGNAIFDAIGGRLRALRSGRTV